MRLIQIRRADVQKKFGPPEGAVTKRYEPLPGLAYAQLNERTDQGQRTGTARPFPLWRLRSGLCCRPSIHIREWHSARPDIAIQHSGRLFGSGPICQLPNSVTHLLHTAG
jgi:hypothetical protein